MKYYTRVLLVVGLCLLGFTAWLASSRGWGLPGLRDPQAVQAAKYQRGCPDWQRDSYGNCPPRTHRTRMGVRNFVQGGGK